MRTHPGRGWRQRRRVHEAAEIIMSTDFYRPAHSIIWERLAAMADRGLPMTVQTLSAELRTAGDLDRVQGTCTCSTSRNGACRRRTRPTSPSRSRPCPCAAGCTRPPSPWARSRGPVPAT
ncbi:DnaB-like helicase N-terminal domain-containing protein [Nocardiopsis sp. LDBS0036]|uniref:DnaB-like helicase N-terminal domain-containing protein n=1 Tax=Nocardiopsis sp. LDBS0036 TaxID=3104276 RepID=UPI0035176832